MDVKESECNDQKLAEEKIRTWCIRNDAEPDVDLRFFQTHYRENLPEEVRLYRGLTWLAESMIHPEFKVPENFQDWKMNDTFVVDRTNYQSWSKNESVARSFAKRLEKGIVITAVCKNSELLVDTSPSSCHREAGTYNCT
jgi:hypothetical protein